MVGIKLVEIFKKSVFFLTLILFSGVLLIIKNDADPDLWHRMAVGKIFSQTGWVVYNDIFSYLPRNEMWVDHEWLSGIIFYTITNFFGDYGLITLQILLVFSILFLIYKINHLINTENKYRISYYLIVLIAIHAGFSSPLRCQVFTYLFFTLWIYLLERIKRGELKFIWIFPATMLLWANMHGGFLAGIGLVGFYLVGDYLNKRNISKYFLIFALIIPVTLINPYGFKYWSYIFEAATMHRPYISEWKAFNPFESFYKGLGFKALILILFSGYGYRLFRKITIDKVEIVALTITFFLAIKHERHVAFFAIIAASYSYQHFTAFLDATIGKLENKFSKIFQEETLKKISVTKDYSVYLFLISASVYILSSLQITVKMDDYPVKSIEFIKKNNISGNLFIPFNWGSYAMWKLFPQNLINIDGRFEEVYKIESYLEVSEFTVTKKFNETVFNKYHHDIFILQKDTMAYEKLKSKPDWRLVFEEKNAGVFLPASTQKSDWKMPENDPEYYIKTKYKNQILF
ncbi:MAG TPA: hypothetical protein P5556_08540 [Candidatus Gastranaerophilales bacterium]|nr:hypothetical protein [Candidatus Gastranaerophilales bacterium]